jgi:hypothetical protein
MGGGKQAARKIDERLMSKDTNGAERWERLFPPFEHSREAPPEPSLSRRHAAHALPAASRVLSQQEVVAGLNAQEVLEECRRCLHCDLKVPVSSK